MLTAALFIGASREACALKDPNQFCTGDPCVINSPKGADPGIVLDFGTRTVIVQNALELLPLPSGAIGSLTIKAGRFSVVGNGQIKGFSTNKAAGTLTINAVDTIQFDDTLSTGAVRLSGRDGGTLTLTTTTGSLSGAGRLALFGDGTEASGGKLIIASAAGVNLTGRLDLNGGSQGSGGSVDVTAAGDVSMTGDLQLFGGGGGGGALDITAGGALTLGAVDISGSGEDGDGGQAFLSAGGNVRFLGAFDGRGSDNSTSCGDAGALDVTAGADITITAPMHMQGRGLDCSGGSLSLDGQQVFLQDLVDLSGAGSDGDGGDLDASGATLVRFADTVALDGGTGGAGDVSVDCDGDVDIPGAINAQGRTSASDGASVAEIAALRAVTISGTIDTSGGGTAVAGADLDLSACAVTTQSTAVLRSTGSAGSITIAGSDSLVLRGRFTASNVGGNHLRYKASQPNINGAIFVPTATQVADPTLVACQCHADADCADGRECTADVCIPQQGCTHTPVVGPCDDHNPCTLADTCSGGGTCIGTQMDCSDGDPCTSDVCNAGACTHPFNTAPCSDGDPCTSFDRCSNGTCIGGPPTNCDDHDVCTADACQTVTGCTHDPIADCTDSDGDALPDDVDPCTTRAWSVPPQTPPDQNPSQFALALGRLAGPVGTQTLLVKGLFNVAPSSQLAIDPSTNGAHLYLADALGALLDASLPGGPGCGSDGWVIRGGSSTTWQYRNRSGALPPGCLPGSAHGIESVRIKDRRQSLKAELEFKIKAKNTSLLHTPAVPLTLLQFSLALAAQPTAGSASLNAQAGQCAEARFAGHPIESRQKPYCKTKLKDGVLSAVRCRGE